MSGNLSSKYAHSPSDAFKDIESRLAALNQGLALLSQKVTDKNALSSSNFPPPVASKWKYVVTEMPLFSNNIYQLEENEGWPKRWLGPSPTTNWSLHLRRDLEYRATIVTVDVPQDALIYATVDGYKVEVVCEEFKRIFVIPVDMQAFYSGKGVALSIWIDESKLRIPKPNDFDTRILAFSINSIKVEVNSPIVLTGVSVND